MAQNPDLNVCLDHEKFTNFQDLHFSQKLSKAHPPLRPPANPGRRLCRGHLGAGPTELGDCVQALPRTFNMARQLRSSTPAFQGHCLNLIHTPQLLSALPPQGAHTSGEITCPSAPLPPRCGGCHHITAMSSVPLADFKQIPISQQTASVHPGRGSTREGRVLAFHTGLLFP